MTFNELLELDKKTELKQAKPQRVPASPAPAQPDTKAVRATATKDTTTPGKRDAAIPSHHDTMTPRHHDTTTPRQRDTMTPRQRGVITVSTVRSLRKDVRVLGKEVATHRFTREEKDLLADIVYTYGRQGYRTSENEVVRIGVHWLIADYQENGKQSVLHRVLKALMS